MSEIFCKKCGRYLPIAFGGKTKSCVCRRFVFDDGFGTTWSANANNIDEAVNAVAVKIEGMKDFLSVFDSGKSGMNFIVTDGDKKLKITIFGERVLEYRHEVRG